MSFSMKGGYYLKAVANLCGPTVTSVRLDDPCSSSSGGLLWHLTEIIGLKKYHLC